MASQLPFFPSSSIFLLFLLSFQISFAQNNVITNCAQCPSPCTPLSDNSNVGKCCGVILSNTTNYCDTFCLEQNRVCCGCNYVNQQWKCVSCLPTDQCSTIQQNNGTYHICVSGLERLIPLWSFGIILVFFLILA